MYKIFNKDEVMKDATRIGPMLNTMHKMRIFSYADYVVMRIKIVDRFKRYGVVIRGKN